MNDSPISKEVENFILREAQALKTEPLENLLSNNGLQELVDRGLITPQQIASIQQTSSYGVAILSNYAPRTQSVALDPEKLARMCSVDYLQAVSAISDNRITAQEHTQLLGMGIDIPAGDLPIPSLVQSMPATVPGIPAIPVLGGR